MKNVKYYIEGLDLADGGVAPNFYQIVIHNDDYTPMEFVMHILEKFFYMDRRKAAEIMLQAHMQGKAVCGMYSKDVAESKITLVKEHAKQQQYPFNCSMEFA